MGWSLHKALTGRLPAPAPITLATATSPDDIICAAIVQSIAKDYDNWTLRHLRYGNDAEMQERRSLGFSSYNENCHVLTHKGRDVVVSFCLNNCHSKVIDTPRVNGVDIPLSKGEEIHQAYEKIRQTRAAAKAAADRALKEMERNEKAWGLAEKLLNMKRNEAGALVPIQPDPVPEPVVRKEISAPKRRVRRDKQESNLLSPIGD